MLTARKKLESSRELSSVICSSKLVQGQELVFDFAFRYMGMGHIEVLSCDLTNHLLFKRDDGGANGWEREAHYNELLNYKPGDKKYLFFTQWKKEL